MSQQTNFFPQPECEHYISLLQENITRMATNSSNCKTWFITLIAAIFAIGASKDQIADVIWLAYIPTLMFFLLDCFYLGIERRLRRVEKRFITLVTKDPAALKDECQPHEIKKAMYKFALPDGHKDKQGQLSLMIGAMLSWSTTPFYLCVALIILYVQHGFSFCFCQ